MIAALILKVRNAKALTNEPANRHIHEKSLTSWRRVGKAHCKDLVYDAVEGRATGFLDG